MGQVAFWSNRYGQSGNSTNMIAVATLIGMEYVTRTLISHTHWSMSSLESTFLKGKTSTVNDIEYSNVGIDALERLARSNRLTPNMVKDYADTILRDRLELLRGTAKPNEEMFSSIHDVIESILDTVKGYYNLSLIDVSSGTQNELTNIVLATSDVIVVNLNQNIAVLEEFFDHEQPDFLKEKQYVIVLGQYDRHSKYSVSNIKRMYKPNAPIFTVPHCTGFMDALNDKSVVEFFLRNKNIGGNHDNHYFMAEVRKLAKGIFEAAGVDTKIYSEQGA
ncbi:chromosome partitioning protein ParA [Paenibacillus oralis]|uniref:Chromosome partitioning protein ParA n=1 Tax=Paenibacillus oralis TaxID=2490856 RepID=A0A3P3TA25_9BACL|nr:chromosome partitioning protein ParA [Paenibacillus oralis]RRJ54891.1 chromosome partitioning protein ParA [Paenibacillus oralis]